MRVIKRSQWRTPIRPRGDTLTITEITSEDAFDAIRASWNTLLERLPLASPFHSWEWNRTWWRYFGQNGRLRILIFRRAEAVVGIAQLYERRHGIRRLGVPSLVPIGWENGVRIKGLTEELGLLFPEAERPLLLSSLALWLEHQPWSAIVLPGLKDSDALPKSMARQVVRHGSQVPHQYLQLPPTWDEFVSQLNKSMRDNVKYYPRLLTRSGFRFTFQVASTADQVGASLPHLFDLNRARVDAPVRVRHEDDFRSVERRALLRDIGPVLAERGEFKVGLLFVEDKPVAAQAWLEKGEVAFLSYSGYLPGWARYSVGMVATSEMIKHSIERGMRRLEFFRGTGHVRERWGTSKYYEKEVILGRPAGLLRLLLKLRSAKRKIAVAPGRMSLLRRLQGGRTHGAVNETV
jgi:CelD/BcsL family acetyltransferase involved in cellulose biosynthesis